MTSTRINFDTEYFCSHYTCAIATFNKIFQDQIDEDNTKLCFLISSYYCAEVYKESNLYQPNSFVNTIDNDTIS